MIETIARKNLTASFLNFGTQIGLVDYINAFKNLKFSVDKSIVTNLSSINVFAKINGKVFTIDGVSTKELNY